MMELGCFGVVGIRKVGIFFIVLERGEVGITVGPGETERRERRE